jgi:hypothetical protein
MIEILIMLKEKRKKKKEKRKKKKEKGEAYSIRTWMQKPRLPLEQQLECVSKECQGWRITFESFVKEGG